MGRAKEAWLEAQERGWASFEDECVCSECFEEEFLSELVTSRAEHHTCSYCGRYEAERAIAADMNEVMPYIAEGLYSEWRDPAEAGLPYESAEGGWLGRVYSTYDLLWDLGITSEPDLFDAIVGSVTTEAWTDAEPYRLREFEELRFSWREFERVVKEEARYVFFRLVGEEDVELSGSPPEAPYEILDRIAEFVARQGLVAQLPAGTTVMRARIHSADGVYNSLEELGPPRRVDAKYANRMSAAGIPLFYGALDAETATEETYAPDGDKHHASIGEFVTTREMPVLDLARVPSVPSLFDPGKREERAPIQFMNNFALGVSHSTIKDGREHIEYVPTQIVAEYFRHVYAQSQDEDGARKVSTWKGDGTVQVVRGIKYASAQHEGGVCIALFLDHPGDSLPGSDRGANEFLKLNKSETVPLPIHREQTIHLGHVGCSAPHPEWSFNPEDVNCPDCLAVLRKQR